uniref:Uncharacterized protein n=1 Tax=Cyprinus carpio carpio TaxID=630221 RepID=A0A9J8AF73_CYPCA
MYYEDLQGSAASTISLYVFVFSRRFYPKQLRVDSGYTFFTSVCVPWELNSGPFALLTQCYSTEPQEHYILIVVHINH